MNRWGMRWPRWMRDGSLSPARRFPGMKNGSDASPESFVPCPHGQRFLSARRASDDQAIWRCRPARMSDNAQTFLEIANDSPYPIRLASLL